MSTKYYNVDFFNKILGNGLQFDLSPDIYNIIKELDNNATEYIATLPQPTEPIKRNVLNETFAVYLILFHYYCIEGISKADRSYKSYQSDCYCLESTL